MNFVDIARRQEGRIFILGAGFSAAAGIPTMDRLLDYTAQLFSSKCPGIFERVKNYTQIAFSLRDAEPGLSQAFSFASVHFP